MTELTVGAGLARGLARFAIAKGADADALLARAGIAAADLDDQDKRVPMANYIALMRAAQELSGDAAIALHYGEQFALFLVVVLENRASKETHGLGRDPAGLHRRCEQGGQGVEFLQVGNDAGVAFRKTFDGIGFDVVVD